VIDADLSFAFVPFLAFAAIPSGVWASVELENRIEFSWFPLAFCAFPYFVCLASCALTVLALFGPEFSRRGSQSFFEEQLSYAEQKFFGDDPGKLRLEYAINLIVCASANCLVGLFGMVFVVLGGAYFRRAAREAYEKEVPVLSRMPTMTPEEVMEAARQRGVRRRVQAAMKILKRMRTQRAVLNEKEKNDRKGRDAERDRALEPEARRVGPEGGRLEGERQGVERGGELQGVSGDPRTDEEARDGGTPNREREDASPTSAASLSPRRGIARMIPKFGRRDQQQPAQADSESQQSPTGRSPTATPKRGGFQNLGLPTLGEKRRI